MEQTIDPTVQRVNKNVFHAHECQVTWVSPVSGWVENFSREITRDFLFDPFTYEIQFSRNTNSGMKEVMAQAIHASSMPWYCDHVQPDPMPVIGMVFDLEYHLTLFDAEVKAWYLTNDGKMVWEMRGGETFPLPILAAIEVLKSRGVHVFPQVSAEEAMESLFC